MQRPLSIPLIVSLLVLGACRGPDLGVEPTHRLVAEVVTLNNERADMFCTCSDEFGFPSMDECQDYFMYVGPDEHDCLDDIVVDDREAAHEHLECLIAQGEALVDCLQPWTCEDGTLADRCQQEYRASLTDCPPLPLEMIADFRACVE